jgi:acyl-coenzyme A thioesterase PaaI-like protein
MILRWYNRNIVGTHFGGSLCSMIDPHFMLLLMQLLGKGYFVWDKASDIEFIKASKDEVTAVFKILDAELNDIKLNTDSGEKYFPTFKVEIRDKSNDLVAKATKTIYIKKKPAKGASWRKPIRATSALTQPNYTVESCSLAER